MQVSTSTAKCAMSSSHTSPNFYGTAVVLVTRSLQLALDWQWRVTWYSLYTWCIVCTTYIILQVLTLDMQDTTELREEQQAHDEPEHGMDCIVRYSQTIQ